MLSILQYVRMLFLTNLRRLDALNKVGELTMAVPGGTAVGVYDFRCAVPRTLRL